MSLTVAIHQPQYLPWPAYFDKADQCDVFVHLDTVQFQRAGFQNRNQIKTAHGPLWLTVPVHASRPDLINEVRIAPEPWAPKHVETVFRAYSRAPHLDWFRCEVADMLAQPWERLVDLNLAIARRFFACFGIRARQIRASEIDVTGSKDDLIIAICRALGADTYLSGEGARAYQDPQKFVDAGIELKYQSYAAAEYAQCHAGLGFLPNLSALDMVLNLGVRARDALMAGRR
jgi:hypothetical protein